MIYLIESAAFKEVEGKKEYFSILKIGYTSENGSKSRIDTYITENPTIKILYLIPKLSKKEEKTLHYYFREYLFNGREWFEYKIEIIEFFNKLFNIEGLENKKNYISNLEDDQFLDNRISNFVRGNKEAWEFIKKYRSIVPIILAKVLTEDFNNTKKIDYILLDAWDNNVIDLPGLLNYFKKKYSEKVINEYEERMNLLDPESKIVVEKYYRCTCIDKLKLLCENNINDLILSNIPDSDRMKTYFLMFGPEKIKATWYNLSFLKTEFEKRTYNNVNLYIDVFNNPNFSIGIRIECSTVKEIFREIYTKNNSPFSPKATDLKDYFEVKEVLIPVVDENGKKKRSKGYEILGVNVNSKYYKEYVSFLSKQK